MWILLLMVMTSDGLIAYDQGHYETFSKCYNMKEAMLAEGFDAKEVVKKAGIRPIKALREAMMAEGLEAKMIATKAELQLPRSSTSSGIKESFNVSENQLSELYKLLHQYHNNDSVDADRNSLLNSIQEVLGGIEMFGLNEVTRTHEANRKMIQSV